MMRSEGLCVLQVPSLKSDIELRQVGYCSQLSVTNKKRLQLANRKCVVFYKGNAEIASLCRPGINWNSLAWMSTPDTPVVLIWPSTFELSLILIILMVRI